MHHQRICHHRFGVHDRGGIQRAGPVEHHLRRGPLPAAAPSRPSSAARRSRARMRRSGRGRADGRAGGPAAPPLRRCAAGPPRPAGCVRHDALAGAGRGEVAVRFRDLRAAQHHLRAPRGSSGGRRLLARPRRARELRARRPPGRCGGRHPRRRGQPDAVPASLRRARPRPGRLVAPGPELGERVGTAVRELAAEPPAGTARVAADIAALPPADNAVAWLEELATRR